MKILRTARLGSNFTVSYKKKSVPIINLLLYFPEEKNKEKLDFSELQIRSL